MNQTSLEREWQEERKHRILSEEITNTHLRSVPDAHSTLIIRGRILQETDRRTAMSLKLDVVDGKWILPPGMVCSARMGEVAKLY